MSTKPLSWVAKRRGGRYCAPACGSGCTWAAYQTAKIKARALAAVMNSGGGHSAGWVGQIWENMGWHYGAAKRGGGCKIHVATGSTGDTTYWAEINAGGQQFISEVYHTNPHIAFAEARAHARKLMNAIRKELDVT